MDMNLEKTSDRIHRKLTATFAPISLEVIDESAKHAGHAGHRPGGETHFRVKIISPVFKDMNRIAQHRAIYEALADDIQEGGIHALALDTSAPTQ
jgi:BolA protein